jgi:hypothetical protein
MLLRGANLSDPWRERNIGVRGATTAEALAQGNGAFTSYQGQNARSSHKIAARVDYILTPKHDTTARADMAEAGAGAGAGAGQSRLQPRVEVENIEIMNSLGDFLEERGKWSGETDKCKLRCARSDHLPVLALLRVPTAAAL